MLPTQVLIHYIVHWYYDKFKFGSPSNFFHPQTSPSGKQGLLTLAAMPVVATTLMASWSGLTPISSGMPWLTSRSPCRTFACQIAPGDTCGFQVKLFLKQFGVIFFCGKYLFSPKQTDFDYCFFFTKLLFLQVTMFRALSVSRWTLNFVN